MQISLCIQFQSYTNKYNYNTYRSTSCKQINIVELLGKQKERSNKTIDTTMHLRIEARISLIVLTIVDLCLCVPNLADETNNSNNGLSVFKNKNDKFDINSKQYVIGDPSDDNINIDSSEQNVIHGKLNASPGSSSSGDYVDDIDHPNFLITNYLSDGEIERRIHFNGITAKETLVSNSGFVLLFFISLWSLLELICQIQRTFEEHSHRSLTRRRLILHLSTIQLIDFNLTEIIRTIQSMWSVQSTKIH